MILSKLEAVEQYGTDNQIKHFHKYKKFVSKRTEDALIETLKQHFDLVETIKIGRAYHYKLEGKLEKKNDRFDLKKTGVHKMKQYTKNLDMMVIAYLEQLCHKDELPQMTMNDWMSFFGIVHPDTLNLYRNKYNKRDKFDEALEEMVDVGAIPFKYDRFVEDYFEMYSEMKQHLARTLSRLERAGIIKVTDIYHANGTPYVVQDVYNYQKGQFEQRETYGKTEVFEVYQSVIEKVQQYIRSCHSSNFKEANDLMDDTPVFRESMNKYKHKIKEYMSEAVSQSVDTNYKINYIFGLKTIRIKEKPQKIIAYLKRYIDDNPDAKELIETYEKDKSVHLYREMFFKYLSERNNYVIEWSEKKQKKYQKMIDDGSLSCLEIIDFEDGEIDTVESISNLDHETYVNQEELNKRSYISRIQSGNFSTDIQNIDRILNRDLYRRKLISP